LTDEITSSDWVLGNASSTSVLVEYSDFQCPACAAYFPLVERLINESSTTLRFAYRHFPLTQHANAMPASQASEAAGLQGKFWEMYTMLFETHDEWENSTDVKTIFDGYATKLGLDMDKYSSDFASQAVIEKINNDMKSGVRAGVDSTPTFFLNGKKLSNPQDYDEFKKIIDENTNPQIKP
jgi:protein-disulfide isomerase